MGTWLQMTALPWLVYSMTKSAILLGLVAFLSQIFILVISPFAGSFADKYDRKKLLFITQGALMAQAGILSYLTITNHILLWHILVISTFLGLVNAFDMTIRQSFIIDLVPKENLMNAIGLNSLIFNMGRLVGPAIAALIIAKFGEGYCFLFNTISYIAVFIALAHIIPISHLIEKQVESFKEQFLASWDFIKKDKRISSMLILLAVNGVIRVFPMVVMPVFVKDVYGMGANGLGLFMSSIGCGALLATITVAGKQNTDNIGSWIYYSSTVLGSVVILFATITNIYTSCFFLAISGYCMVVGMSFTNTYIQIHAPTKYRSTIIGFFITSFLGFTPIGSLFGGNLSYAFGPQMTTVAGGILTLITALWFSKKLKS
jgi:MFS family permease